MTYCPFANLDMSISFCGRLCARHLWLGSDSCRLRGGHKTESVDKIHNTLKYNKQHVLLLHMQNMF